jgi:hypothetical protein
MHIPQQSPEEEQRRASQPLYEFVADSSSLAATPGEEQDAAELAPSAGEQQAPSGAAFAQQSDAQATQAGANRPSGPPPSAEAIRQGLVYPPPPSFYQDVQENMLQTPLPFVPSAPPSTAIFPPPGEAPPAIMVRPGAEYLSPPPGIMPPARKSRKWMWVVLAMLGGVLLLSCGLCTWAGYMFIAPTVQDQAKAVSLVNDYYEAIQSRNYNDAYLDLALKGTASGLTREQFIQQAESRDSQYGPVRSYVSEQPSLAANTNGGNTTGLNLSHLTVTVNVSRARLSYPVVLSLEKVGKVGKVGDSWKIVDFDRI